VSGKFKIASFKAARVAGATCAVVILSACGGGDRAGDFGRRGDSILTGEIMPRAGLVASWWRGEPTSLYPFTDDERELRDRAWRFLMPAYDKANLQQRWAELSTTRILPPMPHSGRNHYHLLLMADEYRSVASRYRKIESDIEADRQLMMPFTQIAARVCEADRVRIRSLKQVREMSDIQREQAVARVAENRMLVDWVRRDMREKAEAYRYAMEHLTIEAPMREGIRADQAIIALESAQQTLDYWEGCGEHKLAVPPAGHTGRRLPPVTSKDSAQPERYVPASPRPVDDARGRIDARPPK
jgi:hypothetical protein